MANLTEDRIGFESLGSRYPAHDQVIVEKEIHAGIETYRFTPPHIAGSETVVYLHGGAFIYGSIRSHGAMISHIAAAIERTVLYIEYSLAPENPFPKALNEATAVIQALAQNKIPFALMGDSAGGNFAMSTALNLRKLAIGAPLYHVLISPWVDLNTNLPSYTENEKNDPILVKGHLAKAAASYTDPKNFANPLVSPVFGSFEGFAPTITLVGHPEILRDDSLAIHRALEKAGSKSALHVFEGVTHVWPLSDIESEQSRQALRFIREFIDHQ